MVVVVASFSKHVDDDLDEEVGGGEAYRAGGKEATVTTVLARARVAATAILSSRER